MKIGDLETTSPRGQVIMILLAALLSLKGGRRKQEVLDLIKEKRWFDIRPEDRKPYPRGSSKEPRWETLLAWGRKDALDAKLLEDATRDNWELSKEGQNKFIELRNAYRAQTMLLREIRWVF